MKLVAQLIGDFFIGLKELQGYAFSNQKKS